MRFDFVRAVLALCSSLAVAAAAGPAAADGVVNVYSYRQPDLIKPVLQLHREGRREAALAAYARILPLINFENRQCGLRATKTVMQEGGVIASDAVRHPLEALHPATRAGLLELARAVNPLALRWGK